MMHADNLVVFLGADANTDDSTEPWEAGSGRLPNDDDLAHYIAKRAHLEDAPAELAAVAQRACATHGASALYDWLVEGLTEGIDTSPSEVLQRLAELPSLFRKHEREPRYQIIVTTALMERSRLLSEKHKNPLTLPFTLHPARTRPAISSIPPGKVSLARLSKPTSTHQRVRLNWDFRSWQ